MKALLCTVFGALLTLAPVALTGQQADHTPPVRHAPTRVPLTIALVQVLPHPSAPYEIQRRPSGDVVLVPESATAEQLSDAVRGVLTARLVEGDTARHGSSVRVRPRRPNSAQRPAFPWAQRVLGDLRRAPVQSVAGVGTVRAVKIWLPRQARAGRPATFTAR
jgi:hypothetical protein